jgi:hypothetical protein
VAAYTQLAIAANGEPAAVGADCQRLVDVHLPALSAEKEIDRDGCDQIVELGLAVLAVLRYGTRPSWHALVLGGGVVRFGPS